MAKFFTKNKKNIDSKGNVLSIPSIVTIDPFSLTSYKYQNGELLSNTIGKNIKKNDLFVSYISAKDVVTGSIEIGGNIPDEDIKDALEIKAYEDLGLDTSIDYKFSYFKSSPNSQDKADNLYNVFAINSESMVEGFNKVEKKVPYIDYITTSPFLIKSLYKKNILTSYGNECFIFFQKNDAFLAIYQDGEYVYSKSLKYSLSEICEKFSTALGERIDEEKFYSMLMSEGLKPTEMQYQQHFMKVFGEVFLYINDVAVFARRSSNINQIDRVYIGTELGNINGMNEYVKSYLGTDVQEFNFGLKPGDTNNKINQIHILMILTAQLYLESGQVDDTLNFTIYKRPAPISQRLAGKFLAICGVALILSMLYPVYEFSYGGYHFLMYNKKNQELKKLLPVTNSLRTNIASLEATKDQEEKILQEENNVLTARRALLREIHNKRVNYSMKAGVLVDLIQMLNGNDVKLEKIYQIDDNIVLSVVSKNEKKITELMDEIAKTNKYSIRTKVIFKDTEQNIFKSDIEMEIL